jgi:hypothetical protein
MRCGNQKESKMKRRNADERPEAAIAARLEEIRMTPAERRDALHALQMGSWLVDLLATAGTRARGLGRAVIAREIRRKRARRKQASRDTATRRPARA